VEGGLNQTNVQQPYTPHSLKKLRDNYKQSTMAAVVPPIPMVVPPGGAPAVATAPHLPFGGDPGTITGWLLDATSTTSSDISRGLEQGFNWLVTNIPDIRDAEYDKAIQNIFDEVVGSDMLFLSDSNEHRS
jgi:hypothetical protein